MSTGDSNPTVDAPARTASAQPATLSNPTVDAPARTASAQPATLSNPTATKTTKSKPLYRPEDLLWDLWERHPEERPENYEEIMRLYYDPLKD